MWGIRRFVVGKSTIRGFAVGEFDTVNRLNADSCRSRMCRTSWSPSTGVVWLRPLNVLRAEAAVNRFFVLQDYLLMMGKTDLQSFLMLTTSHPFDWAAFSDALSFSAYANSRFSSSWLTRSWSDGPLRPCE